MATTILPIAQRIGGVVGSTSRAAFANFIANNANLPAPPGTFDVAKRYLINLSAPVQVSPGDPNSTLRPTQQVIVSGTFAAANAAIITGAQVVGDV